MNTSFRFSLALVAFFAFGNAGIFAAAIAADASSNAGAASQQQPKLQPVPDGAPPPPPPTDEQVEPQVTIKQSGENKVEEYRINGKLYMVKVSPLHGPPYYLYDSDGTGTLIRHDGPGEHISPPQWVLYKW